MATLGDFLGEWHKASKGEKALIVGGGITVIGVAWYLHNQAANNAQTSPAQAATNASGLTSGSTPGNNGGIPQIQSGSNQYPLLPYGTNPIYDPSGNLIGFQNSPPATPTNPNPTPVQKPLPPVKAIGQPIVQHPIIKPQQSKPGAYGTPIAQHPTSTTTLAKTYQKPPVKQAPVWHAPAQPYRPTSTPQMPTSGGAVKR